mmetsp:Transcript_23485/g.58779  ORF Transcript_23485/g.58779 Transcript_23485/m.58779 type:complete len:548 (-) Transcript_23485:213-1856(-)
MDPAAAGLFAAVRVGDLGALNSQAKQLKKKFDKSKKKEPGSMLNLSTLQDETGQTLLHVACELGNLVIVRYLLERLKLDVNVRDKNGWTPLHSACKAGQLDITDYLLSFGADGAVTTSDSDTPLHYFARCSDRDCNPHLYQSTLERLVKVNNVLINLQNKHGETALHSACLQGRKKCVEYLIKNGAQTNRATKRSGDFPIHSSIRAGKLEILKILVDNGVQLKVKCRDGNCLELAQKMGHADLVHYLESLNINWGDTSSDQPSAPAFSSPFASTANMNPYVTPPQSTMPQQYPAGAAVPPSSAPPTNFSNRAPTGPACIPPSSVPPSSVPPSSVPLSSVPPSSVPPSSVPPSSNPPSSNPPMYGQPQAKQQRFSQQMAAVPPSSVPPSIVPPSFKPPSSVPPTSQPPPHGGFPPQSAAPSVGAGAGAPRSSAPPSHNPPGQAFPPSSVPPSSVPPSSVPPSSQPPSFGSRPPSCSMDADVSDQVRQWLAHLSLEYCFQYFMADGWDDLQAVALMRQDDLQALKIPYRDQLTILAGLAKMSIYMAGSV